MTLEQQEFWSRLKCDAQYLAHTCGKEMQGKSEDTVNKLAKNYLSLAMNNLSRKDLFSVVKTWLNYYHLPLNPEKLGEVFDKFHQDHSTWVLRVAKDIKIVEDTQ